VAASTLATWRAELNDRGDQVQDPEIQCLLPYLRPQTWESASRAACSRLCQTEAVIPDRNREC
jgi:hypothetical protein